ncbi:MAG: cysteine desulfurase family protein [Longimicrobiales bacterium]|nr:cysteine desulfurase family protein [Longimicrobiales bacterium]
MDPIYLDHAATTPMRAEVREAMAPYHSEVFGNPSSTHRWGRQAQAALERARGRVADALGVERREVVFVRGGTESDNLALLGRADATRSGQQTPCIVTSAIEHKAVLDAARSVEVDGGRAIVLPVDGSGVVDLDTLDLAFDASPSLVSVMWVNNEIGVVQPIEEIVERCRHHGVPVHSDGVQAIGKIPVRLDDVPLDLLSISGHKVCGPKSSGALFVRAGTELHARIHGGGQEGGLRPGTQDVAGAVGLAEAVTLAVAEAASARTHYLELRDRLIDRLRAALPDLRVHGAGAEVAGHILSVGIPGLSPEMLMISLDMEGLAVSGGSACQSGSTSESHVLRAIYGNEAIAATIRYSFGRTTTRDEIEEAAERTARVVQKLRVDAI